MCPSVLYLKAGAEGAVVVVAGIEEEKEVWYSNPEHQLIHHCPRRMQSGCSETTRQTSEMIMDLGVAVGTRSKGPHLHPCGQISYQSLHQGHREPQSGDTPVTYCPVPSQQR